MSAFAHEFTWTLPASRDEVFAALTQPVALRQWFAEKVDIDLRLGGSFRFWGKHTLESASKDKAAQTIIELEDKRLLRFSWQLFNQPTNVLFKFENIETDNQTLIFGRHSLRKLPKISRAKEMIDDLWRLHGGNLKAYLSGGDGITLPNYDAESPEIRQSIIINADKADVFNALITPHLLKQWMWGDNPVVDAKIGGEYSYNPETPAGPTKILDYVENELLITNWQDWRGDAIVPMQTVTWRLESVGKAQTRVTVVHAGFIRTVDFSDYPFGWATFLRRMKSTVEKQCN